MTEEELKLFHNEDYPADARGSCLVIGTPPLDRKDEAVPIDLVRAVLYAVLLTRANLRNALLPLEDPNRTVTRVEVYGAIPRELMQTPDPTEVFHDQAFDSGGDTGRSELIRQMRVLNEERLRRLEQIEDQRALVVKAMGDQFSFASDLKVATLSEKLREGDARMEFIGNFTFVRSHLLDVLRIEDRNDAGEITGSREIVLKQALVDVLPDWMKKGADSATIDRLINYALVEMLVIIRKATKQILLLHYPRERRYVDVARAYLRDVAKYPSGIDAIDRFVRMPPVIDGLKLPPMGIPQGVKPHTVRLKTCESYRVAPNQEDRRILLYPPDSLQEIERKLMRRDLPRRARNEYILQMIVPILEMVRMLSGEQSETRRQLDEVLPQGILDDPNTLSRQTPKLLEVLHELVILPLSTAITNAISQRAEMRHDTLETVPVGGGEPPKAGGK